MQPIAWYIQRLHAMSANEVAWHTKVTLRNKIDRCVLSLRQRNRPLSAILTKPTTPNAVGFHVTDMQVGEWTNLTSQQPQYTWKKHLQAKADRIAENQLTFFDLNNHHLGNPIDWNRDHKSNTHTPMKFAPSIDYRDHNIVGDCKFVWEPNRHHQLVVLARAYRATNNLHYAKTVINQLDNWIQQNPYGIGINWRSGLELAIRLINWVWAIDMIRDCGLINDDFRHRFLNAAYQHIWQITRTYSYGSSANNHIIGEAAGVFIATSYFTNFKNAAKWNRHSRKILCRQIIDQTYRDGGTREQAFGYHVFVMHLVILAGLVARWTGQHFPEQYWARMEKMFEFLAAVSDNGKTLPMIGDCDDGYVLDLGSTNGDVPTIMSLGAILFERPDFKACSAGYSQPARWLFGPEGRIRFDAIKQTDNPPPTSLAFPDTGYYLLGDTENENNDKISVLFDCGQLGYKSIAAHGHADALSFTLRAFGQDVLLDPGTYDYFTYPHYREYFRSTRAHNTVVVDHTNQSQIAGPFLWSNHAKTRCLDWQSNNHAIKVTGEHNGYNRLDNPVTHNRTLELKTEQQPTVLTITDKIITTGKHHIQLYFHLAEHCRLKKSSTNCYKIHLEPGTLAIQFDPRLTIKTYTASENPIAGWISRHYHQKTPTTTIVANCTTTGNLTLTCKIKTTT